MRKPRWSFTRRVVLDARLADGEDDPLRSGTLGNVVRGEVIGAARPPLDRRVRWQRQAEEDVHEVPVSLHEPEHRHRCGRTGVSRVHARDHTGTTRARHFTASRQGRHDILGATMRNPA